MVLRKNFTIFLFSINLLNTVSYIGLAMINGLNPVCAFSFDVIMYSVFFIALRNTKLSIISDTVQKMSRKKQAKNKTFSEVSFLRFRFVGHRQIKQSQADAPGSSSGCCRVSYFLFTLRISPIICNFAA
jgi:hypothetical protein